MNHTKTEHLNNLELELIELVFYNSHHIAIVAQTYEFPLHGVCGRQIYSRILLWNGFEYIGCVMMEQDEKLRRMALETKIREIRNNIHKFKFV